MSIHKQDLPKNSAPGFNLCLFLSLSHSLHFSLPHILRLAQAWLLGSCSSLPSQRQLALLSYFINYVNDVLLSVPATEHHQVPPLNACKWACLQANWPPPLPVSAAYRDSLSCVSSSPEPWTQETSSSKPHGPALPMFVYPQMFLRELFVFGVFWKFTFLDMNLIQ